MDQTAIREIANKFCIRGEYQDFKQNTAGLINKTFIVRSKEGDKVYHYVLQTVNTAVFTHPKELIRNISSVTGFLREKIKQSGGDASRETLCLIPTHDGELYYIDPDGKFWRMYNYIEGARTYDLVENDEMFYRCGKGFGHFQRLLADYPADTLYPTIPRFHDTPNRLCDFKRAIEENRAGRAAQVAREIAGYLAHADFCDCVTKYIENGEVPVRVTHNDTKLNNIMIDCHSGEAICVIDLDTVMPGSALYDFGDAIRYGANNAVEDEKDLSKVYLRKDLFRAFTKGFLEEASSSLTERELALIPESAVLMTLECGMRFLGDYLNGDVYFGIRYPEHNLDRARTQLKLVNDMLANLDEMHAIVDSYR
jgi:Ser/Thr protein kinase RdoA (MazF antagonist)